MQIILVDTGWARSPQQARKWILEGRVKAGLTRSEGQTKIITVKQPIMRLQPGE